MFYTIQPYVNNGKYEFMYYSVMKNTITKFSFSSKSVREKQLFRSSYIEILLQKNVIRLANKWDLKRMIPHIPKRFRDKIKAHSNYIERRVIDPNFTLY